MESNDKTNRDKDQRGRFESDISKHIVSRQNSAKEKEMIEKFIKERQNGKM